MRTVFIYTLGMQYTGVSAVFTDILSVLSLSELGMSTAIATALYKPLHENNEKQIAKLMQFYKTAYRFIAIFVFISGLILLPFLYSVITKVPEIKESLRIIFILYIIKTASSYLLIYKSTILSADQKQYIIISRELICSIIKYVLEIIILIIFKNFILYLITEIILTIIQNFIITKKAEKEYPYAFQKIKSKLSKEEKLQLFKNIKGLSMYQISGTVGNSIDNILISKFIGTATSGIYSSYTLIRRQIEQILKQFFSAVTPSIGNLVTENDTEKQHDIFKKIFYISFVLINFCATSMFIIYTPFIKIWIGNDYVLAKKIAFLISFDSFLYILLQAIASFRTANGLFVKGQYRPLIMAIMNVLLSVLLIQRYGIFGTILATIICRFLTQWYDPFLLYQEIFKKPFKIFYFKYLEYILLFIISCILTNYLSQILVVNNLFLDLLYKISCCIVVPNIISIGTTYNTKEFIFYKEKIIKILHKRGV